MTPDTPTTVAERHACAAVQAIAARLEAMVANFETTTFGKAVARLQAAARRLGEAA